MKYSVTRTKQALAELQTTLHWKITLIKAPNVVGAIDEDVEIRCTSVSFPEPQEELNKLPIQGHVLNYVGKTTKNGQISLTFVDGTDAKVVAYFTKVAQARWQGDGSDTTGVQALTKDLQCDLRLDLLGPDDNITQTYTLVGVIFSMQKGITGSQSADPVNLTVTAEYDDFHQSAGGVSW